MLFEHSIHISVILNTLIANKKTLYLIYISVWIECLFLLFCSCFLAKCSFLNCRTIGNYNNKNNYTTNNNINATTDDFNNYYRNNYCSSLVRMGSWTCSYFSSLCFKTRTRACSSLRCTGPSSEVVQDCSTGCVSKLHLYCIFVA